MNLSFTEGAVSQPPQAPPMQVPKKWLTATQAAKYLSIETRTVLLWTRQGKLKGYVLSGTRRVTWRFLHEDLDAMLFSPSVALANGRIQ